MILSVVAEEVRHSWDEPPAQASVVELGIVLGEPENSPPYFESDKLVPKNFSSFRTLAFVLASHR